MPTYLALGDSMSIDDYTGVAGGGAAKQFHKYLGNGWRLDDRTLDGCRMPDVQTDGRGEVITLTIGGNDLLWNRQEYLTRGLQGFAAEHLRLLQAIRAANPKSLLIVGDIYHPAAELNEQEFEALSAANRLIRANCLKIGVSLAPIYEAFRGNESEYLCLQIEPTLAGARVIAGLFRDIYDRATNAGVERSGRCPVHPIDLITLSAALSTHDFGDYTGLARHRQENHGRMKWPRRRHPE